MDWTGCEYVESVPDTIGGLPVLRNTRVTADCVVDCFENGQSALEIASMYDLDAIEVQGLLLFAFKEDQPGYPVPKVSRKPIPEVNWAGCNYVEVIPGKVSGVPILRDSRMPAAMVWACAVQGQSAEEIASDFSLSLPAVEGVLAWALSQTGLKRAS